MKTCEQCGNPLVRKMHGKQMEKLKDFQARRYCNRQCLGLSLGGKDRASVLPKTCKHCGKPLTRKRFNGRLESNRAFDRRVYCDQVCMTAGMEGTIKNLNPQNSRRQSAKTAKPSCEVCSRNDTLLHVHHKDCNPLNNDESNLITVCGSCHRRLHSPNYTGTTKQRKPCRICGKPSTRRDLCDKHRQRLRKYGNPLMTKQWNGSEWNLVTVSPSTCR